MDRNSFLKMFLSLSPYKTNEVLFESTIPGTQEIEIKINGEYEIYAVGAGGGGDQATKHSRGGTGGSGGAFVGVLELARGIYTTRVGSAFTPNPNGETGESSYLGAILIAGGGERGYTDSRGGNGGVVSISEGVNVISTTVNTPGNAGNAWYGGSTGAGGASVYAGYGKGGDGGYTQWGAGYSGTNGYLKIVFKGR